MWLYVFIAATVCQTLLSLNADKIGVNKLIDLRGPLNPELKSNRAPEMAFIEQRLDNFNPNNNERWQMVR